ncbi:MAG: hypothetical protein ACM3MB_04815 [Acidobacteriota bacterium]
MGRAGKAVTRFSPAGWFFLPVRDFFSGLETCLSDGKKGYVLLMLLSSAASWWVYVPVHELLHALGCVLGGGKVTRLEISGIYGAALLKKVFPFVSIGSEYSGRLVGFDTGGSDFTYFFTDFLPYLLTILIGVPLLRFVALLKTSPTVKCIVLGLAAPLAYAPFMSATGDYYEMGSLLISKATVLYSPLLNPVRWRSDDFFRLIDTLSSSRRATCALDGMVVTVSLIAGVIMAFATYWAGAVWARTIIRSQRGLKTK